MYLLSFWNTIIHWDQSLFKAINTGLANPFFDGVMPFVRNSMNWAPLYLFLLVFVLLNFRIKGLWWALFFLVTVALTDMSGTYLFKHMIERARPCKDPYFFDQVRLVLKQCSGGSSFISNHAANHFGMAVFFFITFRNRLGNWVWVGIAWAAVIAFAQVYVGVHYPFDIICGALLGLLIGFATASLFNKMFQFSTFDNQPAAS